MRFNRSHLFHLLAAALPAAVLAAGPASADPIEDFYKGKQLRLVIGYSPGGGYDIYGRLTAEFLGNFIPGKPRIVPQNMPGAGSMVAARHLHSIAPKDGTVLAILAQTLPLDVMIQGSKAGFKIAELPYVGRLTSNIDFGMGAAPDKSRFKSIDDLRKKEFVVAATAGTSPANIFPKALNRFAGTKFKILVGYPGSQDMVLALERGEVDLIGANGLASTMVRHPTWITKGERLAVYQAALTRHPLLPKTPTIEELGLTPEGKAVLRALAGSSSIGRSIMTTPGVPAERLAALRKAFQTMLKDKDFLAAVEKRRLMLDPATGEELDKIAEATSKLPDTVVKQIADTVKQ
ncbi:MAG: Bug family tripartite tricarboxylate transporter substrate binding protein [Hyphomicrobiaceae bacterium]